MFFCFCKRMSCWKCSDQRWGANYNHLLTSFPGTSPRRISDEFFIPPFFFKLLCFRLKPSVQKDFQRKFTREKLQQKHLSTTVLSTKNGSVRFLFEEKQILNQKLWRLFFTRSPNTLPKPYIHSKTTSRRDWSITGRYLCWSCCFMCYLYVPTVGDSPSFRDRKIGINLPMFGSEFYTRWSQRLVFFP